MKVFRIVAILSVTALVFLYPACSTKPFRQVEGTKALFQSIAIGMDREEVEKLLGKPILPEIEPGFEVWYLSPPKIRTYESPCAPGSIGITYSGGKVVKKTLNPQVR